MPTIARLALPISLVFAAGLLTFEGAGCSSGTTNGAAGGSEAGPGSGDDGAVGPSSDAGGSRGDSSTQGDAGDAGAADTGSTADGAVVGDGGRLICLVSCTDSTTCAQFGGGKCNQNQVCSWSGGDIKNCSTDPDCIPYGSSFEIDPPCTSKTDCSMNEACISFQNKGICHRVPGSADAGFACSDYDMVEIDWKDITGATIKICGRTDYVCDAHTCRSGCTQDSECTNSSFPKCDTGRKKCICQGTSCQGGTFNGEVCLDTGECGCHSDADCAVKQGFDKCYGTTCGCSSSTACDGMVQGASVVCVPPQ